jgi:hypothetical protein
VKDSDEADPNPQRLAVQLQGHGLRVEPQKRRPDRDLRVLADYGGQEDERVANIGIAVTIADRSSERNPTTSGPEGAAHRIPMPRPGNGPGGRNYTQRTR